MIDGNIPDMSSRAPGELWDPELLVLPIIRKCNQHCFFCEKTCAGADAGVAPEYVFSRLAEARETTESVSFTGGEPTLQLDEELVDACHHVGIEVGLETNGTGKVPAGVDWICVSPKPRSEIVQTTGHELKSVYPQPELSPTDFEHLDFQHYFLQPMDAEGRTAANIEAATRYCLANPKWRLPLQTHKLIGIP